MTGPLRFKIGVLQMQFVAVRECEQFQAIVRGILAALVTEWIVGRAHTGTIRSGDCGVHVAANERLEGAADVFDRAVERVPEDLLGALGV